MSDITDPRVVVERLDLDVLAVQWDGTEAAAARIVTSLDARSAAHGFRLGKARFHRELRRENSLEIGIERHADKVVWEASLDPGDWLAIFLFKGRINHVAEFDLTDGDILFRPRSPVIQLLDASMRLKPIL